MPDPFDFPALPDYGSRERSYPLFERLRNFFAARDQEENHLEQLRALEALHEELQNIAPDRMSSRRVELQRASSRFTPRARDGTYGSFLPEWRRSRSNTGQPFQAGVTPREFEGLGTAEEAEGRMGRTNAERMELLDGESETPTLNPSQQNPSDDDADRPRAKRIKLDSDDKREGLRGMQYGHYGQVVPGPLEMEIVSCDGGSYEPNGKSSWPGNILVNDSSVYCTKGDRCNIILRHPGEIPFTLRKLTIKGPKSGFDSPYSVQEGMVFVSMDADSLPSRTARRNIASANLSSQNPASSNSQVRVTIDHDDRSEDEAPDEGRDRRPLLYGSRPDDIVDLFVPVDTDTDNTTDSDIDLNSASTFHAFERSNRRRLLEARREAEAFRAIFNSPPPPPRRHRHGHSPLLAADPFIGSGASMEGETSSTHQEVMKPHAHFLIERNKSKVSIRFDPPASGRYILVKLWSRFSGGNIDIQSIIANGFAGPRYFPASGLR